MCTGAYIYIYAMSKKFPKSCSKSLAFMDIHAVKPTTFHLLRVDEGLHSPHADINIRGSKRTSQKCALLQGSTRPRLRVFREFTPRVGLSPKVNSLRGSSRVSEGPLGL
eukprot:GHVL01005818.1.p4 GENE.GHVL01005818.1~~GHVL01005818.1.p4  ORF type:complete len:109 (+),score=1.07 GHVL01005818.1:6729-7055(+)